MKLNEPGFRIFVQAALGEFDPVEEDLVLSRLRRSISARMRAPAFTRSLLGLVGFHQRLGQGQRPGHRWGELGATRFRR